MPRWCYTELLIGLLSPQWFLLCLQLLRRPAVRGVVPAAANSVQRAVMTCSDFAPTCNQAQDASFNVYGPILVSCQKRVEP